MGFSLDPNYIDVPTRIAEFRAKHPLGSFQQVRYELLEVGSKTYLAYTAAVYRTPDDERPGIGTAWEPVPGTTPYTKDSEMQNAETAAWGRAIVAALAADTNRGIASAEEVRNRSQQPPAAPPVAVEQTSLQKAKARAWVALKALHPTWGDERLTAEVSDSVLSVFGVTVNLVTPEQWHAIASEFEQEKASAA